MSAECFNCDIVNGAVVLCPLHAAAAEMHEALEAHPASQNGSLDRSWWDSRAEPALRHARGES